MFSWFIRKPSVSLEVSYIVLRAVLFTIAVPLLFVLGVKTAGEWGFVPGPLSFELFFAIPLICFVTAAVFEAWRLRRFRKLTVGDMLLLGSLVLLVLSHAGTLFTQARLGSTVFFAFVTLACVAVAHITEQQLPFKTSILNTFLAYAIVAPVVFLILSSQQLGLLL